MSNIQYAFLMRSRVPTREALQASIDALGFNLQLDPAFTPFTDSGFSPCILNGISNVGFEIFYENAGDLKGLENIAGSNDFCISMAWHVSMQDCATVMIVSCALAKDFDAVITFEGEPPEPLDVLLSYTRDAIEEAEKAAEKPAPQPVSRMPLKKPWWKFW